MQTTELVIARKRQIEMHALQVGPAMSAAVEDPVKGFVDGAVIMRPEFQFPVGIHPRVHRRRQQPRVHPRKNFIDPLDVRQKLFRQPGEYGGRAVGLQLDDVQGQFVRPRDRPALDIGNDLPRLGSQHLIRDWPHIERGGIDEHVLQFHTKSREQRE